MKVITLRKILPAVGREISQRAKKSGQSLARVRTESVASPTAGPRATSPPAVPRSLGLARCAV